MKRHVRIYCTYRKMIPCFQIESDSLGAMLQDTYLSARHHVTNN